MSVEISSNVKIFGTAKKHSFKSTYYISVKRDWKFLFSLVYREAGQQAYSS